MLKGSLIIIAGWGYPASALTALCRELNPDIRTVPVSTHELGLKGNQGADDPARCNCKQNGASLSGCVSFYAEALLALIREQGERAAVVGWSMGGLVALEVAAQHPKMIDRLALIAGTPKFCAGGEFTCGVPVPNVRAMRLGLQRDPNKIMSGFYRLAAEPFKEPVAAIPDQVLGWRDELTAGLDYLLRSDLRSCLKLVRVPVLVLHGREDSVIPWQAADHLNRGLPDSRLRLYAGIGHDLPLRESGRVAKDISEFLS